MLAASQMLISRDAVLQWRKIETRDMKSMHCQIILQKIMRLDSSHSADGAKI